MLKKVFIFGANGMLGSYFQKYLSNNFEIISITRNNLNALQVGYDMLDNIFTQYDKLDECVVINCIGVIPHTTDNNSDNVRNYFIINSLFPVMLSFICKKNNMRFIHITTDCVYSGEKGNYRENDVSDETKIYGVSKSLGEFANGTIIRTSVIGEEVKEKLQFLEWVRGNKNNEINGFVNHYWNGVTCLELSKIINKIIEKDLYWRGVRHIFSPNIVSKYELANIINDVYDLNIKINKFDTNKVVDKSLSTNFDINSNFNIPQLIEQIEELKEYNL